MRKQFQVRIYPSEFQSIRYELKIVTPDNTFRSKSFDNVTMYRVERHLQKHGYTVANITYLSTVTIIRYN